MMDKKKILLLAGLLGLVLIGVLVFGFRPSRPETDCEGGVTQTLGDGIAQEMADSKSEAFRGRVPTDVYFEQLGAMEEEEVSLVSAGETPDQVGGDRASAGGGFADGGSAAGSVDRVFGAPPASSSPPAATSAWGGGGSSRPLTEQERLEYDRRRAEMVRDVLAGGGAASGEEIPGQARDDGYRARDDGKGKPANDEKGRPANDGRRMEIPGQARNDDYKAGHDELGAGRDGNGDGVISYLDDGVQDAAVGYEGARRPVRCMFVRDQKLTSGQRVMVRLLEDAVVDGVRIPANTHLAAVCKIGERLELSVRSLEMGGRIVPLGLEAYDADGVRGIYCPETASSRGARRASEEAMQLGTRTFGGLVGDVAAGLLRTGASLVRSVSGEVSVRVVSGYEFYLVEK